MDPHRVMRRLNANHLHGHDGNWECFIEDVSDPDGRLYRLEYQCRADGQAARAFCRFNPWGPDELAAHQSHLMPSGEICVGPAAHGVGYELGWVVDRARFWCVGYSYLREHGLRAAHRDIPGW